MDGAPDGSVGGVGAPCADAVSSPHRTRVRFHLWPFAACRSPSLSPVSCPLFSCPVLEVEAQKTQKNIFAKKNCMDVFKMSLSIYSLWRHCRTVDTYCIGVFISMCVCAELVFAVCPLLSDVGVTFIKIMIVTSLSRVVLWLHKWITSIFGVKCWELCQTTDCSVNTSLTYICWQI